MDKIEGDKSIFKFRIDDYRQKTAEEFCNPVLIGSVYFYMPIIKI